MGRAYQISYRTNQISYRIVPSDDISKLISLLINNLVLATCPRVKARLYPSLKLAFSWLENIFFGAQLFRYRQGTDRILVRVGPGYLKFSCSWSGPTNRFRSVHPCHTPDPPVTTPLSPPQKKFRWSETFSNSTLGMHPKYEFFCRKGFGKK